jgi:Lar family restriction alleviation protein
MTNGEKFKTAEERAKAFDNYCISQKSGCNKCPLNKYAGDACRFKWLDLEYKAELKLCPFCGTEARLISGTEDHYVVCRNDDCAAALVARSFSSEEEAIDAWNRRAK